MGVVIRMKKLQKASAIYLGISVFTILFEWIYLRFSHGMSSGAMTYLFLCPLVLGTGVYGVMNLAFADIIKSEYYRFISNAYNTAIAALMAGLLLKGIFEIAGSGSGLLRIYFGASYVLFGIASIILLRILICRDRIEK
jgi:hypothetical protein